MRERIHKLLGSTMFCGALVLLAVLGSVLLAQGLKYYNNPLGLIFFIEFMYYCTWGLAIELVDRWLDA